MRERMCTGVELSTTILLLHGGHDIQRLTRIVVGSQFVLRYAGVVGLAHHDAGDVAVFDDGGGGLFVDRLQGPVVVGDDQRLRAEDVRLELDELTVVGHLVRVPATATTTILYRHGAQTRDGGRRCRANGRTPPVNGYGHYTTNSKRVFTRCSANRHRTF